VDINYVHGSQNVKSPRRRQDQEWGDSTWNAPAKKEKPINKTRKVTQSPRPRGSTPRGKKKQSQYGAPALDPPWKGTEVAQAPQQPSTASNSQAEQHLQELLAVLETSENPLSADVQKVVEKTKQPPATAKSVRQAFHHLEQKRKQLMAAQKARSNLHQSWNNYLEDSIKRWRTFAEDFAKKDEALEKRVSEVKEAMIEAREKHDAAKSALDKRDAEVLDAEEISDDMEEDVPERLASAEEIQTGIQTMLTTLENGRVRPTEDADDGQAAKKARLDGTASALGSGAMQPFGKPDK
jgi:membrane-associated HD superfamily phosphohydrolase